MPGPETCWPPGAVASTCGVPSGPRQKRFAPSAYTTEQVAAGTAVGEAVASGVFVGGSVVAVAVAVGTRAVRVDAAAVSKAFGGVVGWLPSSVEHASVASDSSAITEISRRIEYLIRELNRNPVHSKGSRLSTYSLNISPTL